jgi:transposase
MPRSGSPAAPRAGVGFPKLELPEEEREAVDSALRQIEFLDSEIAAVEQPIPAEALRSPQIRRLMTVPGVNVI